VGDLLIVGALYAVLSAALTFGPRTFLQGLVAVLLVPLLCVINAATFAVWYREVDGGGPAWRRRKGHACTNLLFPR